MADSDFISLKLTDFTFPEKLASSKLDFRFIIDLRIIDAGGKFTETTVVLPGLDTYWECDTANDSHPYYVRENNTNKFNMNLVGQWGSLVFFGKVRAVHSVQIKVVDVERKDAWDVVKGVFRNVIGLFFGKVEEKIPLEIFGSANSDLQSLAMRKVAGGSEVLFCKSWEWGLDISNSSNPAILKGQGVSGKYEIHLNYERIERKEDSG